MNAQALTHQCEEYLAFCAVERNLSSNTIAAYRRDLEQYLRFLTSAGVHNINEVAETHVSQFLQSRARLTLASSSVARIASSVRGFHRFALRERWVQVDVAKPVLAPNLVQRLPKALSIEEIERLLAAGDAMSALDMRARALADLLYSTGARVSEALALDVDDVSGDARVIVVRGKGNKQRMVPIGTMARQTIDEYLTRARPTLAVRGTGTAALFVNERGGRLSRQSAGADLELLAKRAGLTRHVTPHALRHSFATHLLSGGADIRVVQELLGHASVATTQIYTKVTIDQLRDVYLSAHPRATKTA